LGVRQGWVHDAVEARTKKHGRIGVPLLATVFAAVGLAACGSSSPASTTVTVSASAPAATSAAPATTPATTASTPTATAKPAKSAPRNPSHSSSPSASGSGGGAAGFRAPSGDNSIPNYGNEAPPTERERATTALAAFLRARAGGEWPRACTYLAATTRTQLERLLGAVKGKAQAGGCGRTLAALSKGPAAAHADSLTLTAGVAALRIKGKSAFALFHGPKGSKYVMPMVSEGGAWKMSQLAPLPYPLGSAGAAP
jgi:hypothetical protein